MKAQTCKGGREGGSVSGRLSHIIYKFEFCLKKLMFEQLSLFLRQYVRLNHKKNHSD